MTRRLTHGEECWLRETAAKHAQGKHVAIISGELVLLALAELDAARAELAARDLCEACGDVLAHERPRCERHVHTERGDPEWTMP